MWASFSSFSLAHRHHPKALPGGASGHWRAADARLMIASDTCVTPSRFPFPPHSLSYRPIATSEGLFGMKSDCWLSNFTSVVRPRGQATHHADGDMVTHRTGGRSGRRQLSGEAAGDPDREAALAVINASLFLAGILRPDDKQFGLFDLI
jgi:hypothetical protein